MILIPIIGCAFAIAAILGIYYGNRDAFIQHDEPVIGDGPTLGRINRP